MFSVLSYNILFGKQVDAILAWLSSEKEKSYDIICFQEFPKVKISMVKKMLKPRICAYASNTIYKGGDYGQLTVVLNKKITMLAEEIIWIGRNFFEEKLLQLGGERSSLLTLFKYGRQVFFLANSHLIAYGTNELKRKQLKMIVSHIERVTPKKKNIPTVMVGDFNYSSLLPRQKLFSLIKQFGYKNAHKENTHRLLFFKKHQLDYIFYKNSFVKNVKIRKESFSDHQPMSFQWDFK